MNSEGTGLLDISCRFDEIERIGKFGSWEWNLKTGESHCSKGLFRIAEWPDDARPTYRSFLALIEDEDRIVLQQAVEASLISKQHFAGNFRFFSGNRSVQRWMRIEFGPVSTDRGEITSVIALVQDVTEKIHGDVELAEMARKAELASRKKEEFLANISHEIRTPMNGILGICNLLLNVVTEPEHRDHLKIIQSCGNSLVGLINDILDFSKLEADQVEFESVPFSIPDVVQEIIHLFSASASEKNIALSYGPEPSTPYWVFGDPGRLKQILANLVSNAIKFTEKGRIRISSEAVRHTSGKCEVQFSVKDSGVGISEQNQSKLFKSFAQADASTTRKYGGTGLGLAICKRLCEKMGGKIWLKSEIGHGTTFSFTLLLSEAEVQESNDLTDKSLLIDPEMSKKYPLKLLLAEDNPVNQVVALGFLKLMGYVPDVAFNGREVLDRLKSTSYDVIFMDNQMPEMDGIEATKEIRRLTLNPERPYIVALTASAMKENIEECFSAGMNDFISKPVQKGDLAKALIQFLSRDKANHEVRVGELELIKLNGQKTSFDKERFTSNYIGLEDVQAQTIQNFLRHCPKLIQDIQGALAEQNAKALQMAAHTLKGTVSNFYAESSRVIAEELERIGRAGDLSGAGSLVERLIVEIDKLRAEISEIQLSSAVGPVQTNGKTILIVDDSEFYRGLLAGALSKKGGYNLLQASHGDECLAILGKQNVDLILMDILMPGIDGTQLLQMIRQTANPMELPIIMITSNTEASDVVEALHLGANDYITKPVNFEVALSRISTHLKLAEISFEMAKFKELAALHAMVSTYNHEINNPLAIALGCLASPSWNQSEASVKKLEDALWRIADIVKQIARVTEKEVQYQDYVKSRKIVKLR